MDEKSESVDLFTVAIEHVRYEGQILWQIFGAFLLPHTVFLAFLLQAAFGGGQMNSYRPGVFLASVVGGLLCIPWSATFSRSLDYYAFRMAQARKAEPSGWNLLKGDGELFSEGKSVAIGERSYCVHWLGRVLMPSRSAMLLIVFFALIYLGIFILSGPWW